jgi:hypothetical protein
MSAESYGGTGLALSELEALPMVQADALLAEAIEHKRAVADELARDIQEAESLLRERMQARGATAADCGPYEARLEFPRLVLLKRAAP